MKTLYTKHYKKGLEYHINRHLLGLKKADLKTDVFYFGLIAVVVVIGSFI